MGSIEAAFGSTGSMKNKIIHVGAVKIYNNLTCEDDATFEGGLSVCGDVTMLGSMKLGDTTITEDDFNKSISGVPGVLKTWSEPPTVKKMRVDHSGKLVNDEGNDTLLADTAKVQNQIVTKTGVLVGNTDSTGAGDDDTYILPNRVNTRNVYADNIHERTQGRGITVQDDLILTNPIKPSSNTAPVKVKGGLNVTGTMGNTTLQSAVVGDVVPDNQPQPGHGDLIVQGDATFNGNVKFSTGNTITLGNLVATSITCSNINTSGGGGGGSGGTSTSSDTIQCNKINALTSGKSITIEDPIENLQTVIVQN